MDELSSIMAACRKYGVISFERGGNEANGVVALKLLFAPKAAVASSKQKDETDPLAAKREHYSLLLNRTPTDKELELLPDHA